MQAPTLFRFNDVPVNVKRPFWLAPFALVGMLYWLAGMRRPQRTVWQRLGVALLGAPLPFLADIGHALAHTFSARYADAPMDEVLLGLDMPRTLYENNDVTPNQHRLRAIGGPIYSSICLLLSLLWRMASRPHTLSRELADVATASNAFIFGGSLLPWPIVDGGVLLKWTLVKRGRSSQEADAVVRRATIISVLDLALSAALLGRMARKWRAADA